jgi:hypothetical protein
MSFVNLFITNNFSEHACEQTTQFQTQTPVTVPELKRFLGLMFVTQTINKPALKLCWSKDPVFKCQCFKKTIAQTTLKVFCHFSTSVTAAGVTSLIN